MYHFHKILKKSLLILIYLLTPELSLANCNQLVIDIDKNSPWYFAKQQIGNCAYGDILHKQEKSITLEGGFMSGPECTLTLKNRRQLTRIHYDQNYCALESGSIEVKKITGPDISFCSFAGSYDKEKAGLVVMDPSYKKYKSKANHLNMVSYNVFDRPLTFISDGQNTRMHHLPALLQNINGGDIDVIAFQEAFNGDILRQRLCLLGFSYQTPIIQDDTINSVVNGGIFIASRWPFISKPKKKIYRDACSGFDCQAAKGVVYAKIRKSDKNSSQVYHVFATHLQAGTDKNNKTDYHNIRMQQAKQLFKFLSDQQIPKSEAVIISGDLNTDWLTRENRALKLFEELKAQPSQITDHSASSDPQTNALVGLDGAANAGNCCRAYMNSHHCQCCKKEFLDYILYSQQHRKPINKPSITIYPLKADRTFTACISSPTQCLLFDDCRQWNIEDVSDHYPVFSHFEF